MIEKGKINFPSYLMRTQLPKDKIRQAIYRITVVCFIGWRQAAVCFATKPAYCRADWPIYLDISVWIVFVFRLNSCHYRRSNLDIFDALVTVISYLNHMGTNRFSLLFTSSYALYEFLYFFRCLRHLLRCCVHGTSVKKHFLLSFCGFAQSITNLHHCA